MYDVFFGIEEREKSIIVEEEEGQSSQDFRAKMAFFWVYGFKYYYCAARTLGTCPKSSFAVSECWQPDPKGNS